MGSDDYYLYALDAGTGEEKWNYRTDSWVYSSPAVSDGIVYVGSNDGYMYAFDAETGDVKWESQISNEVFPSPAVTDGIIYAGSDIFYLYALDAETGDVKWKYKTEGEWVSSSPAVVDGVVYVGSSAGHVYAIGAMNTVQTSTEATSPSKQPMNEEEETTLKTPAFGAILTIACMLASIGLKRMRK